MRVRTDEELTQIEEYIDQRCREERLEIGSSCPLYTIIPNVSVITSGAAIGLTDEEAWAFANGYDERDLSNTVATGDTLFERSRRHPELYAMGGRFRERVLAEEYVS